MNQMANKYLRENILQVVDNQLQENNPAITKATFERLKALGYTKEQAKEKIAAVLLEEIYDLLKNNESYNEVRYTKGLEELK